MMEEINEGIKEHMNELEREFVIACDEAESLGKFDFNKFANGEYSNLKYPEEEPVMYGCDPILHFKEPYVRLYDPSTEKVLIEIFEEEPKYHENKVNLTSRVYKNYLTGSNGHLMNKFTGEVIERAEDIEENLKKCIL